ncbi:Protein of unknown function [Micromonospora lupini str. Lupac 08]|uniref:Uncharacterized protein n=1 Tax=Micromonospora lupini str. Lupac 08 TaxID=1150864 RepID=I0LD10_9ACTN|nr:Protein of unknown function [Micromonospora lupini str. Lupac 08]
MSKPSGTVAPSRTPTSGPNRKTRSSLTGRPGAGADAEHTRIIGAGPDTSALPKLVGGRMCLPLHLTGGRATLVAYRRHALLGACPHRLGRLLRGFAQVVLDLVADLARLLAQATRVLTHHVLRPAGELPFTPARRDQRGGQQTDAEGDQSGGERVALRLLAGLLPERPGLVAYGAGGVRHPLTGLLPQVVRAAHHLLLRSGERAAGLPDAVTGDPTRVDLVGQGVDVTAQVVAGGLDLPPDPIRITCHR